MPASPPVTPSEIIGITSAPEGWFADYQDGNALEVVCWGLIIDNTGAVPMVFDLNLYKVVDAATLGAYVLVHSVIKDNIVTLVDQATEPGAGPAVSLGGLYSRKSTYCIADAGVTFSATLRGSLDDSFWFDIGTLNSIGVESEVLRSVHYVQAVLDSVSGGPVTIRMAWS